MRIAKMMTSSHKAPETVHYTSSTKDTKVCPQLYLGQGSGGLANQRKEICEAGSLRGTAAAEIWIF